MTPAVPASGRGGWGRANRNFVSRTFRLVSLSPMGVRCPEPGLGISRSMGDFAPQELGCCSRALAGKRALLPHARGGCAVAPAAGEAQRFVYPAAGNLPASVPSPGGWALIQKYVQKAERARWAESTPGTGAQQQGEHRGRAGSSGAAEMGWG